jgi:hypothetical protein
LKSDPFPVLLLEKDENLSRILFGHLNSNWFAEKEPFNDDASLYLAVQPWFRTFIPKNGLWARTISKMIPDR